MYFVVAQPFLGQYSFFFNDTATTEIYTLSLHDALPICLSSPSRWCIHPRSTPADSPTATMCSCSPTARFRDRKSTRLNSSHSQISYAVFCLKKKNIFGLFLFLRAELLTRSALPSCAKVF